MNINGVWVHPQTAFINYDDWYSDLINRAIPAMGEEYMRLFINAEFDFRRFLMLAAKINPDARPKHD